MTKKKTDVVEVKVNHDDSTKANAEKSTNQDKGTIEKTDKIVDNSIVDKKDNKDNDGKKRTSKSLTESSNKVEEIGEEMKPLKYERPSKIEKSNVGKTIQNIFRNKDKYRFDLEVQRNEVWNIEQKSRLIESVLIGYPIPPITFEDRKDGFYWIIDGQQRLTTFIRFLNGEWAISKKFGELGGFAFGGCKFRDLKEEMQAIIHEEVISMIKLENMTDEERDSLFVRYNSGTGLKKIEYIRAKYTALQQQIKHISSLYFFDQVIGLTNSAKTGFSDQNLILTTSMLLETDDIRDIKGTGSPQIESYVDSKKVNNEIFSDELMQKIEKTAQFLSDATSLFESNDRKNIFKKVHLPIIFLNASEAVEDNYDPERYGLFLREFFIDNYQSHKEFVEQVQKGSSSADSVKFRINELKVQFRKYNEKFNENESDVKVEV